MEGPTLSARYDQAWTERHDPEDRPEQEDARSPFEVDRARIVHASAFRRLQGKTQIFGAGEADDFRTRLTHTMEVAQVGKGLALHLNRDPALREAPMAPELVEAACLAHDLGHPPFGHNGEAALQARMAHHGGFEGNAQTLRLLAKLEAKRPGHGLNLTRGTLQGVLKYLQAYQEAKAQRLGLAAASSEAQSLAHEAVEKCYYDDQRGWMAWLRAGELGWGQARVLEAEAMEWADDVAYSVHDLEDGLAAGLVKAEHGQDPRVMARVAAYARGKYQKGSGEAPPPWLDEVAAQKLVASIFARLDSAPGPKASKLKALTSGLIHGLVSGVGLKQRAGAPKPFALGLSVPPELRAKASLLMGLEYVLLIRHPRVTTLEHKGQRVVKELFEAHAQPDAGDLFPEAWQAPWDEAKDDDTARLRVACDYLAEMTDAHALRLHARMFQPILPVGSLF